MVRRLQSNYRMPHDDTIQITVSYLSGVRRVVEQCEIDAIEDVTASHSMTDMFDFTDTSGDRAG
jgi:hypothetical protein